MTAVLTKARWACGVTIQPCRLDQLAFPLPTTPGGGHFYLRCHDAYSRLFVLTLGLPGSIRPLRCYSGVARVVKAIKSVPYGLSLRARCGNTTQNGGHEYVEAETLDAAGRRTDGNL